MNCPKCNAQVPHGATECPACGVIIDKYITIHSLRSLLQEIKEPKPSAGPAPPPSDFLPLTTSLALLFCFDFSKEIRPDLFRLFYVIATLLIWIATATGLFFSAHSGNGAAVPLLLLAGFLVQTGLRITIETKLSGLR